MVIVSDAMIILGLMMYTLLVNSGSSSNVAQIVCALLLNIGMLIKVGYETCQKDKEESLKKRIEELELNVTEKLKEQRQKQEENRQ